MWILTNTGWLSVVESRHNADNLIVRSRTRGAIAGMFNVRERVTPDADYRYRAELPKDLVAGAVARELLAVDYDNFKNSVHDPELKGAYMRVWEAGYRMQEDAAGRNRGSRRAARRPMIAPFDAGQAPWPPLNCSRCREEIDHAFFAPEPGQPADLCDSCWELETEADGREEDEGPRAGGERRFRVLEEEEGGETEVDRACRLA
jgi:hypothetical protein